MVYGLSMGAAVAITSIGRIADIAGLISMSACFSWDDLFLTPYDDTEYAERILGFLNRHFAP